MLVLEPSIKFDEVPDVLQYSFGGGNLAPGDAGRYAFSARRFWFTAVELLDDERVYKPALDDTEGAVSFLFLRDCSPSVPALSSRPDRF